MLHRLNISAFRERYKTLIENLSYITILQVFLLLAPLITYPYLTRVLGKEMYGIVLTAQMLATYFAMLIDFGSNSVCAKHISLNRDNKRKLSEIVCSVFYTRLGIWIIGLLIYTAIILIVPTYRAHWVLFLLTYGMTTNELFFPQYFYQGMEQMKFTSLTNVMIKGLFIAAIFLVVHSPDDYIWIPVFYSLGYTLSGIFAFWYIFHYLHIPFSKPDISAIRFYIKDSFAVFATDVICSIKDKINYLLVGSCVGMESVVIYDLSTKFNNILQQPIQIIRTVIFPRAARSRNIRKIGYVMAGMFCFTTLLVILLNVFMPAIVTFFLHDENTDLLPIRLFSLAPVILSVSMIISSDIFIALGYNRYVFYSILVTTAAYLLTLMILLLTGYLHSIYSFVGMALIAYCVELIYRLITVRRLVKKEMERSKI
ncbi:MAG: oligosaccharide flippase family protein [Paludibacteraceae bacterium]|nr:oligosaccharide flippase family protein [Paludibacteraceae bacterium]